MLPNPRTPSALISSASVFQSAGKGSKTFDPLNQRGAAPALAEKADNSPEDRAREMEKQVNKLIEQSAEASAKGEYAVALETAKDAVSIARI